MHLGMIFLFSELLQRRLNSSVVSQWTDEYIANKPNLILISEVSSKYWAHNATWVTRPRARQQGGWFSHCLPRNSFSGTLLKTRVREEQRNRHSSKCSNLTSITTFHDVLSWHCVAFETRSLLGCPPQIFPILLSLNPVTDRSCTLTHISINQPSAFSAVIQ